MADEDFVFGQLAEANHGRSLEPLLADPATALHGDQAISAVILDRHLDAGMNGQLFGREQFLTIDFTVDDPAVDVAFGGRLGYRNGFQVMMVLKVRIDIPF